MTKLDPEMTHMQWSGHEGNVLEKEAANCGGYGLRVPPVPIPNTEVKPQHVEGTWLVTAREIRSLPHSHSHYLTIVGFFCIDTGFLR